MIIIEKCHLEHCQDFCASHGKERFLSQFPSLTIGKLKMHEAG